MVIFSANTWGRDWPDNYDGGYDKKWQYCNFDFDQKWLVVCDCEEKEKVKQLFTPKVDRIIDLFADGFIDKLLKHFSLTREFIGKGINYTLFELAEIYLANDDDYICHFDSDTRMKEPFDWVTPGLKILHDSPDVSVISPIYENWNGEINSRFFSDQAYLINAGRFKHANLRLDDPVLEQYPEYGGNSFERLMGRHLHVTGERRVFIPPVPYLHPCSK